MWLPGVCLPGVCLKVSKMKSRQENRSKLSFTARIITKYSLKLFLSIWGEKLSKGFLKFCKLISNHPWRPRQSVGSGEKAGRKFSSTDEISPNYFQKFKRMPAPDWAQKMLCNIVPNRRTVSPEFFSWVRKRRLLSCHSCPVRSPSLCEQGKLLFPTFLTRNERTTDESKKSLGCYQQEQLNSPREYSVFDTSQCIVMRRRRENQISNSFTRQNNNFARASHFFVHFFAVNCTTTRENA